MSENIHIQDNDQRLLRVRLLWMGFFKLDEVLVNIAISEHLRLALHI